MKKVLIIDDEPDKQNMLRDYFEKKDFLIKIAGNVNEALEILLMDEKFDLLILDMHLPEDEDSNANMTGGLEIAKYLYINNNELPYLVFTQYNDFYNDKFNKSLESKYYKPEKESMNFYQDIRNIKELNFYLSNLSQKYLGAILCCYTDDYWTKNVDTILQQL